MTTLAFAAVDWGPTRLRASLVASDGSVVERRASDAGVQSVRPGGFPAALEEACGPWFATNPELPVLMSGMVGSRNGWVEAPYLPCPAGADEIASRLTPVPGTARDEALAAFYERFANDALVIDKWFALQAIQPDGDTLATVRALMNHSAFSIRNPNRVRSLIGSFANANPTRFNASDGSGFDFVADIVVELDKFNAQVAARLLSSFRSWRSLEPGRRARAQAALERVAGTERLSADVADIAGRSLA